MQMCKHCIDVKYYTHTIYTLTLNWEIEREQEIKIQEKKPSGIIKRNFISSSVTQNKTNRHNKFQSEVLLFLWSCGK